jgi:hypothetical protein
MYFEYLVKWKGHPIEYDKWENEVVIQKFGKSVLELMERSPGNFVKGSMMHENR